MFFAKYFSANFLFGNTTVSAAQHFDEALLILALALFVAALILSLVARARKNLLQRALVRRWFGLCMTMGLVGLLWSALRYEQIPLLSEHIIALLIYIIALVWAIVILWHTFTGYKRDIVEYRRQMEKQKYL